MMEDRAYLLGEGLIDRFDECGLARGVDLDEIGLNYILEQRLKISDPRFL
jgi:hypothetical protein